MLKGYTGKIAFVDLSVRRSKDIKLEESICRDLLGGYGRLCRANYKGSWIYQQGRRAKDVIDVMISQRQ